MEHLGVEIQHLGQYGEVGVLRPVPVAVTAALLVAVAMTLLVAVALSVLVTVVFAHASSLRTPCVEGIASCV